MKLLISPAKMQECEKAWFEDSGVRSIDVMERAAGALQRAVREQFPDARSVYFACGPGGNGGDGYACARLMHGCGKQVRIFEYCEAKNADAIENRNRAMALNIPFGGEGRPDVWVDCLYGTGLSRSPSGAAADLIERINRDRSMGTKVVSADIPSGLDGETGLAYDPCVQADVTVTFQYAKYGLYLQDGLDMCGRIIVSDVGFPAEAFPGNLPGLCQPDNLRYFFEKRRRNIHKVKCGHLLVIAGSVGMAGAAILCTRAALRSGVGLVTVACPKEIVPLVQAAAPCAMCLPLPQENGHIAENAVPLLKEAFAGKSAVAIGPGLRRSVSPEIIKSVLAAGIPAVIDADALNIIADHPELKALLKDHHVITPHPGEAARLLGRNCTNPMADGQALAQSGAAAVLKGASRIIAAGDRCSVSASGSSCMARGGSGDILTGIMGALLADHDQRRPFENAICACEIHGLAGEMAAEKYGIRSANAADLIEFLPEVFKKYVD